MKIHLQSAFLILVLAKALVPAKAQGSSQPPNFIIIFADDLGYGDLSCYGEPSVRTPNLDRMAQEGQRWTNFYSAASVCTPSRAAILTGRLPARSGMASNNRRVLFPDSKLGLPPSEITIAEQLKTAGYATAAIGKWHLGHKLPHLPTSQGFDSYFGIPYSNDMNFVGDHDYKKIPEALISSEDYNVPLMRDTSIIERPANQTTITKRYTEEALNFIDTHQEQPFFIYLAHSLPHIPLFASNDFKGKSERGLYGDVIEEIDHGVGEILTRLKNLGLDSNTVVVFTSDNGPWLPFKSHGGSAGPLYAGKGTTWEGGMREPCIFWGPGIVKSKLNHDLGSTLDLFTTFNALAGLMPPEKITIDGLDLSNSLQKNIPSPRQSVFFYRGTNLFAIRFGEYKAHFITQGEYGEFGPLVKHITPLLYHLGEDPGEKNNIADKHPEILAQLQSLKESHQKNMILGPNQLDARD